MLAVAKCGDLPGLSIRAVGNLIFTGRPREAQGGPGKLGGFVETNCIAIYNMYGSTCYRQGLATRIIAPPPVKKKSQCILAW